MPRIRFTRHLERHVACPAGEVAGASVRAALEDYFSRNPAVRSYVLDERGSLRTHVAIFVNGASVSDRATLSDSLPPDSTIDVLQALSGG